MTIEQILARVPIVARSESNGEHKTVVYLEDVKAILRQHAPDLERK